MFSSGPNYFLNINLTYMSCHINKQGLCVIMLPGLAEKSWEEEKDSSTVSVAWRSRRKIFWSTSRWVVPFCAGVLQLGMPQTSCSLSLKWLEDFKLLRGLSSMPHAFQKCGLIRRKFLEGWVLQALCTWVLGMLSEPLITEVSFRRNHVVHELCALYTMPPKANKLQISKRFLESL